MANEVIKYLDRDMVGLGAEQMTREMRSTLGGLEEAIIPMTRGDLTREVTVYGGEQDTTFIKREHRSGFWLVTVVDWATVQAEMDLLEPDQDLSGLYCMELDSWLELTSKYAGWPDRFTVATD